MLEQEFEKADDSPMVVAFLERKTLKPISESEIEQNPRKRQS